MGNEKWEKLYVCVSPLTNHTTYRLCFHSISNQAEFQQCHVHSENVVRATWMRILCVCVCTFILPLWLWTPEHPRSYAGLLSLCQQQSASCLAQSITGSVVTRKKIHSSPISCIIYRRWGRIDDQSDNCSSVYN